MGQEPFRVEHSRVVHLRAPTALRIHLSQAKGPTEVWLSRKWLEHREDVLEEARLSQGIQRMEQIKFAVLERSGAISVIPRQSD